MKNIFNNFLTLILFTAVLIPIKLYSQDSAPIITDITYSEIEYYSVKISWKTNVLSDSKVWYMISDSNYQTIVYTDSAYNASIDTLHSVILNFLNPHTFYNYKVASTGAGGTSVSGNRMFSTRAATPGTIKIYFNRSVDTTVSSGIHAEGNVNLLEKLTDRIDACNYGIDAVVSSFEYAQNVARSLIKSKRNGNVIRFIYDSRAQSEWIDSLIAAGIPVLKRTYDTLQGHGNKNNFWIFDGRCTCSGGLIYVQTSTAELTYQSLFIDRNSTVDINDRAVAYAFTREFDEMWGSSGDFPVLSRSKFGNLKTDNVPHLYNLNGVPMEIYFAPSDSISKRIGQYINSSSHKLYFAVHDFKSDFLKNKFYSLRYSRNIKGIFDYSKAGSGAFPDMKLWADVWIDSSAGLMYHKYLITDAGYPFAEVLTGSYNWTQESELYNDENLIIIGDAIAANKYYQEFHQRYRESAGHIVGVNYYRTVNTDSYELFQNYPNPFNSSTVIKFSIPVAGIVNLSLFDAGGRLVGTLLNGRMNAGTYEAKFNSGNLSSGVYFYTLRADNFIRTNKLIILK